MMDLQTFLISIAVFIILALLIWLITSLTVRERPFEERLEEQRKMEQALMLLGGKQPGAKKDKQKKKNKKLKSGDRDGVETGSEKMENMAKTKTTKMVELEIDPEVIETSQSEPPVSITEKKGKPRKGAPDSPTTMKSILLNKGEKSIVQETAAELVHAHVHKDEVELKHERERRLSAGAVNGFHLESTDGSDELPVVASRSTAEQTKAPASEVRLRKPRRDVDAVASDGGVFQRPGERASKRKPVSNDVTVSGTVTEVFKNFHRQLDVFLMRLF